MIQTRFVFRRSSTKTTAWWFNWLIKRTQTTGQVCLFGKLDLNLEISFRRTYFGPAFKFGGLGAKDFRDWEVQIERRWREALSVRPDWLPWQPGCSGWPICAQDRASGPQKIQARTVAMATIWRLLASIPWPRGLLDNIPTQQTAFKNQLWHNKAI